VATKVIEFNSKDEMDVWLAKKGDSIAVVNVATSKRWSAWTGFIGNAKTYTVTYNESVTAP
jgi:hypothetical protein